MSVSGQRPGKGRVGLQQARREVAVQDPGHEAHEGDARAREDQRARPAFASPHAEEGDEKVATLHLADDPRVPLYEVQDKQVLPNTSLLESFEVSADHKLILK